MGVAQNYTGGASRRFWPMFPLTRATHFGPGNMDHFGNPFWHRFFEPQPCARAIDASTRRWDHGRAFGQGFFLCTLSYTPIGSATPKRMDKGEIHPFLDACPVGANITFEGTFLDITFCPSPTKKLSLPPTIMEADRRLSEEYSLLEDVHVHCWKEGMSLVNSGKRFWVDHFNTDRF